MERERKGDNIREKKMQAWPVKIISDCEAIFIVWFDQLVILTTIFTIIVRYEPIESGKGFSGGVCLPRMIYLFHPLRQIVR